MNRDLAIALGYRPGTQHAPRVLAAGEGPVAERIRQIAERHGVPSVQDGDLADLLRQLPLENEIPEELYPAVAEIFAFLWTLARDRRESSSV